MITDKHLDNSLRYQASNGRIRGLVGVELDSDGRVAQVVTTETIQDVLVGTGGGTVGTGVTASESVGAVRQTLLTLVDVEVTVDAVSTAAGIGGALIFTFPANQVHLFGTTAELTISIPTAGQAVVESTPEGDLGLGSVIITDPTAFSTDATDDDYSAGAAFTMAAEFTDDVSLTSQTGALLAASAEVNVNVFIDAADIDDDESPVVLINGTVTLTYANLA